MNPIITAFKSFLATLASPHLKWFWLVCAGYFLCWLIALFLARLGSSTNTIYRSRLSLAIIMMVHCLTMAIVTILWCREFYNFTGFYWFLTPYGILAIADLVIFVKLMVGLGNYRDYRP